MSQGDLKSYHQVSEMQGVVKIMVNQILHVSLQQYNCLSAPTNYYHSKP